MPLLEGKPVSLRRRGLPGQRRRVASPASPGPACSSPRSASRCCASPAALADGTVTWCTGPETLRDHIVPTLRAAAEAAGRPAPRVIAALPVCVTDDVAAARSRAAAGVPGLRPAAELPGDARQGGRGRAGGRRHRRRREPRSATASAPSPTSASPTSARSSSAATPTRRPPRGTCSSRWSEADPRRTSSARTRSTGSFRLPAWRRRRATGVLVAALALLAACTSTGVSVGRSSSATSTRTDPEPPTRTPRTRTPPTRTPRHAGPHRSAAHQRDDDVGR